MNFWEILTRIIWKVLRKNDKQIRGKPGEQNIIETILGIISVRESS